MLHALTRCTNGTSRFLFIRQFASHPGCRTLSPDDFAEKRRQWSRMSQIILSVDQLLKQEKNTEAVGFFKLSMSRIPLDDRSSRLGVYERGISAFLDHKRFKDALVLHQKMHVKGMFASSGLRAKMLVC